MKKINFTPKTILNIGVGSCPELAVWRNRLPDVALLGVDVRGQRRWNAPFINALVGGQENEEVVFCVSCKSIKCNDLSHRRGGKTKTRTIDGIVSQNNSIPPYFLWMDIEGGELDALKGATKTLLNTPLINLEMREFAWTNNYCKDLNEFLISTGYILIGSENKQGITLEDKLYQRMDWK